MHAVTPSNQQQVQHPLDQECTAQPIPEMLLTHSTIPTTQQSIPIPAVADLSKFDTWYECNQAITRWYHETDLAMATYMGTPELPSWARFAKHASFNAGEQMRNMTETLQAIDAVLEVGADFKDMLSGTFNKNIGTVFSNLWNSVRQVSHLFMVEGLVRTSLLVALADAGLSEKKLTHMSQMSTLADNSVASNLRLCAYAVLHLPQLVKMLPAVKQELSNLLEVIATGNREIYEFMAPRLTRFLEAHRTGIDYFASSETDHSGRFLAEGLKLYAKARLLAEAAQNNPAQADSLLVERLAIVEKGNVFATFGEQQSRVQPRFAHIEETLRRFAGLAVFESPIGKRTLLSGAPDLNWANLYNRMGMDTTACPTDPALITPESFPGLLPTDHPAFVGTIGELLVTGTRLPEKAYGLKVKPRAVHLPLM